MKKTLQSSLVSLTLAAGLSFTAILPPAPASAVDSLESTDAPDLASVRAKIKVQDYAGALAELRDLAEDTQQADVYNLLGYTLRKTGDFQTSLSYYTKALELQPDHKAAREYLGELYVEIGNLDKAKEQLSALRRLCPTAARNGKTCRRLSTLKPLRDEHGSGQATVRFPYSVRFKNGNRSMKWLLERYEPYEARLEDVVLLGSRLLLLHPSRRRPSSLSSRWRA